MQVDFANGQVQEIPLYDGGGCLVQFASGVGVVCSSDPTVTPYPAYAVFWAQSGQQGNVYQLGTDLHIRPYGSTPATPTPSNPTPALQPLPAPAAPSGANPAASTATNVATGLNTFVQGLGDPHTIAGLTFPLGAWLGAGALGVIALSRKKSGARR